MGIETSIGTIVGIITAAASVASTAYTILSRPSKPDLTVPSDREAREAAYAQAEQLRKRRAASTLVTGGEGVTTPATTSKTILG